MFDRETRRSIMMTCIILHNMIVEDERDSYENRFDFNYDEGPTPTPGIEVSHGPIFEFSTMLQTNAQLCNRTKHRNLQADLVEHIWFRFGTSYD